MCKRWFILRTSHRSCLTSDLPCHTGTRPQKFLAWMFFLAFEALLLLKLTEANFGLRLPHASCVSIERTECAWRQSKTLRGVGSKIIFERQGMSSAWWRIGSRRNIRLCCLSLQSSSLPPTLDTLSMHVRRANYQAAKWRRTLHPGSSLPGPHGDGWLCKPECGDDPASHSSVEIQLDDSSCCPTGFVRRGQVRLHIMGCSTQRCRCCKGHFDWNEVCLCTNCENQSHQ